MKKLITVLVSAIILQGCGGEKHGTAGSTTLPPVQVESRQLLEKEQTVFTTYAGTFVPLHSAKLATRLSGWITYLGVEEGDYVKAGQVLVKIDAGDIAAQAVQAGAGVAQAEARIRQAQANVAASTAGVAEARAALASARSTLPEAVAQRDLASTEFRRMNQLYQEGALSQLDYDRYKTNVEVAEAKVAQLKSAVNQAEAAVHRAQSSTGAAQAAVGSAQADVQQAVAGRNASLVPLQYADVASPIDGYVVKKMAHIGEMAGPGQPLLEIQDTKTLRLEVPVPESALWRFEPNKEFKVKVDATKKEYVGRLDQIIPSGDPQSRTFLLKLDVPNKDRRLLPGMYAKIEAEDGKRKQLLVPVSAVITRGEINGVFTVTEDSKASYRLVKIGEKAGDHYQILSGLEAGTRVVLNPPASLKSGSSLELK